MNYLLVIQLLGKLLLVGSVLPAPALIIALADRTSDAGALALTMVITAAVGGFMVLFRPKDDRLRAREGFAVVALAWVFLSLLGGLPFYLSGYIPSFMDSFFETVSGYTTTGATILTDVEVLPRGLLFWRSFTHWVGGVGVLVFAMAVLPMGDGRGMHLMRAEMPGVTIDKFSSKLRDSARITYLIYLFMTVAEVVFLLAGGMPLYDALIHTFGTAGTGGFSHLAASIGAYDNVYFEVVIGVFMLLFGVNFNLYYLILVHRAREAFRSEELRVYFGIVTVAVAAITVNITRMYGSVFKALRYAFFQVSTIITTTGFATVDFNLWPTFSKVILVLLMFFGACAGSTGGGLKIVRLVVLSKAALRDLQKALHPRAVTTVRIEGKPMDDKTVRSVNVYLTIYIMLFAASVLLLSLDHFDLITTFTAEASCLNNIGPGLELVGPTGNFAAFSPFNKLVLSFNMLAGRLELYPMLVIFAPSLWQRRHVPRPVRLPD